ncbi:MAG: hypothetical protein HYY18_03555 [Planctomycetes bacterium]|nr:hypothetical protein [Planctomycetota bacterium]
MPLTPADLAAARSAAETFLNAVVKGDESAARGLLILGAGESLDFKTMHDSTASFELGPAQAEGDRAVAIAAVRARPGTSAPPALPLVLVRRSGAWMVDMAASITRMMGVDVGELMNQMAKGLGEAMSAGMEAMAKGLDAAAGAIGGEVAAGKPKKAGKAKGKGRGRGN